MWSKVEALLPQIGLIAAVTLISTTYLQWRMRTWGERFYDQDWKHKNRRAIITQFILPAAWFWGPPFEELIFRLPLILLFEQMSIWAAAAIALSSALFALEHVPNWFTAGLIWIPPERRRFRYNINPKPWPMLRLFAAGMILGWLAVEYQSLLLVVGVHMCMNVIFPAISWSWQKLKAAQE